MRSIFNDAYALLFSDFLYKTCCGYSFEFPRQVTKQNRWLSRKFKGVTTTYVFIKEYIKVHWLQ